MTGSINVYRLVGERTRAERKRLGLTQEDLAEKTGLSSNFIGHVERAGKKASLETLQKIAFALNLPLNQLFLADYSPPKKDPFAARLDALLKDRSVADKQKILKLARLVFKTR